jgi:signal transduction histidine kinase
MSHELRTPLTNIIGFARLMLKEIDGPLTDQQRMTWKLFITTGSTSWALSMTFWTSPRLRPG